MPTCTRRPGDSEERRVESAARVIKGVMGRLMGSLMGVGMSTARGRVGESLTEGDEGTEGILG